MEQGDGRQQIAVEFRCSQSAVRSMVESLAPIAGKMIK
jgi:cytochrome c-type biogenesis protein CcmH/NrfF